jgi:hypothetical protein
MSRRRKTTNTTLLATLGFGKVVLLETRYPAIYVLLPASL